MDSWWDLGQWSGYRGSELALYDITCAFCSERGRLARHHHVERASGNRKLNYDILRCDSCGNFAMAVWAASGNMHDRRIIPYPLRAERFPDTWPDDVGRFWLQAKRAQADQNWDAAAVMARSALQLALRYKQAKGRDLFGEIDDLASKGELPPLMKEWAHEVRLLARDPAHPQPGQEPTSVEDVRDAIKFLDFLLEYLFGLPASIAKFRGRKQP